MKKFMLKCFLLVLTLFFGVLLGMQEANKGLLELKGFQDQNYGGAFQFKKNNIGEVEAAVLGQEITAHDIEEKQKKLEEMKAFHFFTNLGTKVASTVAIFFQHLINIIIVGLEKALSLLR